MKILPSNGTWQCGMTLLEVMVAIALTALMGIVAFSAIQSASEQSRHVKLHEESLKQLDDAVYWMVSDIRRVIPVSSGQQGGIYTTKDGSLLLTVRGSDMPVGIGNVLSHVEWRLQDGHLMRSRSSLLLQQSRDHGAETAEVILDDVQALDIRFLDAGTAKLQEWPIRDRWSKQWPMPGSSASTLPWAINLRLQTRQWGTIERLVEVPGGIHE